MFPRDTCAIIISVYTQSLGHLSVCSCRTCRYPKLSMLQNCGEEPLMTKQPLSKMKLYTCAWRGCRNSLRDSEDDKTARPFCGKLGVWIVAAGFSPVGLRICP